MQQDPKCPTENASGSKGDPLVSVLNAKRCTGEQTTVAFSLTDRTRVIEVTVLRPDYGEAAFA